MLAPIDVADNPRSAPLTPPMAAPALLAMACFATADEPQLGHLFIFQIPGFWICQDCLLPPECHVWLKLFRIESWSQQREPKLVPGHRGTNISELGTNFLHWKVGLCA